MERTEVDLIEIKAKYDKLVEDTFIEMIDYARSIQKKDGNAGVKFLQDMVNDGHLSVTICLDITPAVKKWDNPYKIVRI